jgi:hypothetical protein
MTEWGRLVAWVPSGPGLSGRLPLGCGYAAVCNLPTQDCPQIAAIATMGRTSDTRTQGEIGSLVPIRTVAEKCGKGSALVVVSTNRRGRTASSPRQKSSQPKAGQRPTPQGVPTTHLPSWSRRFRLRSALVTTFATGCWW